jgi:low affinity Fe/Cu permease
MAATKDRPKEAAQNARQAGPIRSKMHEWFTRFAQYTARLTGRPGTFLLAVLVVVTWGLTGPIFGFSDTWQLVINTGTTIITFLMVFLIQNTQNRDTLAIQLKLSELILDMKDVPNKFATVEDLSDEELEALHEVSRARADETLVHLQRRKSGKSTEQAGRR